MSPELTPHESDFFHSITESLGSVMDGKSWIIVLSLVFGMAVLALLIWGINSRIWWLRSRIGILKRKKASAPVAADPRIETRRQEMTLWRSHEVASRGMLLNVSEHGMFVKMLGPFEKGDHFHFRIKLTESESLEGTAEVVRNQTTEDAHHPVGMGCRFVRVDFDPKKIRSRLETSV